MNNGTFDALDFALWLRRRWHMVAIACGVAAALTLAVSLAMPKRYTAVASLLVQAPGGNDPRASTAVSPVYLESLKSYESLASNDTLFLRALNKFHVTEGRPGSVSSLKNRVLKITKPTNTAMLEVAVTLKDPRTAQQVAQYIAEQTVELSRSLDEQSTSELTREFRRQLDAATARYTNAKTAHQAAGSEQPLEGLENEVREATRLKFRAESDLQVAHTDLAESQAIQAAGAASAPGQPDSAMLFRTQRAAAEAKIAAMEDQVRKLQVTLDRDSRQLDQRRLRRDALDDEERSARQAWEGANARMNEMLSSAEFHGERLQIIDPGVVPDQPASPNIFLNVAAALLLSLAGSLAWLLIRFSHDRLISARAERVYNAPAMR